MGVTGERTSLGARAEQLVANTRAAGAQRVCVGVGVSTREQARQVAGFADGVIVGSAFVRALTDADTPAQGVAAVGRLAEQLAEGIADAAAGSLPAGA
jgi:tryptophan synthase alpha chain